jgi:hypothetical protein
MSQPVAFVTRLMVKPGRLEELRRVSPEWAAALDSGKPETLVFLSFLDDAGRELTVLHVFANAEAMDRHFEGSAERSRLAFELVDPLRWEIYGRPSESAVATLRQAAASAGVELRTYPDLVSGFLHPTA